jgi:hypothetical protein
MPPPLDNTPLSGTMTVAAGPQKDAPFDPYAAAGFTKNQDGSYSAMPAQPGATITAPAPSPAPGAAPAPAAPAEAPFDPYKGAGFIKDPSGAYRTPLALPDKPPPPSDAAHATGTTAADQPWYQSLWNTLKDFHGAIAPNWDHPGYGYGDPFAGEVVHKVTMGFDEDASAIGGALWRHYTQGVPFTQAYTELKQEQRQQREDWEQRNPLTSDVAAGVGIGAGLAGGLARTATGQIVGREGLGALFGSAGPGATLGQRALTYGRNIGVSAALGGVSGFGETEGDLQQRLQAAQTGAEWGGALGVALPWGARVLQGIWRSMRPSAQIERKAGEQLEQMVSPTSTGAPRTPTFTPAPLSDFPLGAGSATGEPGLAAAEDMAAGVRGGARGAVDIRTGQQAGLLQEATEQRPWGRLASALMTPSEASGYLANGMRNAMQVFKNFERWLWTRPSLANAVNVNQFQADVARWGQSMPVRFARAFAGHNPLMNIVRDLRDMPAHATLADINDLRSEVLGISRTDADPQIRMIAGRFGDAMLRAIENNPALRANPAALADYQAARDFTRKMWNTIGQTPFQNIIKATSDDAAAGGRLFRFGRNISGERVPQGTRAIIDALNDIRDQWNTLGQSGLGTAAERAGQQLRQTAIDYITNSMIQPIALAPRDAGIYATHLNNLQRWMTTNSGWLTSSGLFTRTQLDMLRNMAEAARLGSRGANVRGPTGSHTFERLMAERNPRIVDIFSTAMNKRLFTVGGTVLGGLFGHWGEAGIGALLGFGTESLGQTFLHHLYEMPAEALRAKMIEAVQNPQIAQDLMQRARNARGFSDATYRWLRGFSAHFGGSWTAGDANARARAAQAPASLQPASPQIR